jgi:Skp family chaperone for outer membrane proteins
MKKIVLALLGASCLLLAVEAESVGAEKAGLNIIDQNQAKIKEKQTQIGVEQQNKAEKLTKTIEAQAQNSAKKQQEKAEKFKSKEIEQAGKVIQQESKLEDKSKELRKKTNERVLTK